MCIYTYSCQAVNSLELSFTSKQGSAACPNPSSNLNASTSPLPHHLQWPPPTAQPSPKTSSPPSTVPPSSFLSKSTSALFNTPFLKPPSPFSSAKPAPERQPNYHNTSPKQDGTKAERLLHAPSRVVLLLLLLRREWLRKWASSWVKRFCEPPEEQG